MAARLPLLHKTPFVLDARPLLEATSPHAGLLAISRVFRSLGLPGIIAANLDLRQRQRGFAEAQVTAARAYRGCNRGRHFQQAGYQALLLSSADPA